MQYSWWHVLDQFISELSLLLFIYNIYFTVKSILWHISLGISWLRPHTDLSAGQLTHTTHARPSRNASCDKLSENCMLTWWWMEYVPGLIGHHMKYLSFYGMWSILISQNSCYWMEPSEKCCFQSEFLWGKLI